MKLLTLLPVVLLLAFGFSPTGHTHDCVVINQSMGADTTLDVIKKQACVQYQWSAQELSFVEPRADTCLAYTESDLKQCFVDADAYDEVSVQNNINASNLALTLNGEQGLLLNGNGFTIKRTDNQRVAPFISVLNSGDVSFKDITLDDDATDAPCVVNDVCANMVYLQYSNNVQFDNVNITNGKRYVVYTRAVNGFSFINSSLTNSGVLGMYIGHDSEPTTNVVIDSSEFYDNSTNALALLGAVGVNITNNIFKRNHVIGQWPVAPQYGVGLTGGGQVYVAKASDVLIDSNVISDGYCENCLGGIHGIELSQPNQTSAVLNVTISNNTIRDNTGSNIYTNVGAQVANLSVVSNILDGVGTVSVTPTPTIPEPINPVEELSEPVGIEPELLQIQAETLGLTQGWNNRGSYIEWIGSTERYLLSQRIDAANLVLHFRVPTAGVYRFQMRARSETVFNAAEPGNDIWVQHPQQGWLKAWFNRDTAWHTTTSGELNGSSSVELLDMQLPAGDVQITVSGRSRGTSIDYFNLIPQAIDEVSDLVVLNYDSWPDQDDHQSVLMGKAVVDKLGITPTVVIGAWGENGPHLSFIDGSVEFWRSVYPGVLDAHNDKDGSASALAAQITQVIEGGRQVYIAEGGPSDFTARVLRKLSTDIDTKKIYVYQHSTGVTAFNESKTLPENLALVKDSTSYIVVDNGNVGGNNSADFQEPGSSEMCIRHVDNMLNTNYNIQWAQAFNLIGSDRQCDGSDTVELLAIVGDTTTKTFDDFYRNYVQ